MMNDDWYWVIMTIMIHGSGFWYGITAQKNAEKVWFLPDFSMSMYELSSHQSGLSGWVLKRF